MEHGCGFLCQFQLGRKVRPTHSREHPLWVPFYFYPVTEQAKYTGREEPQNGATLQPHWTNMSPHVCPERSRISRVYLWMLSVKKNFAAPNVSV